MKRLLVEGFGTFLFVLVVGLVVVPPNVGPFAPIAFGAALAVLVYAGEALSGAHYNPAITLALWIRKKCTTNIAVGYVAAQIIGAVIAAFLVNYFRTDSFDAAGTPAARDAVKVIVAETIFTFTLALVMLNSIGTSGNAQLAPAAGLIYVAAGYSVVPISGAVLNPALSLGLALMGMVAWADIWMYIVATLVGGALAALFQRTVRPD